MVLGLGPIFQFTIYGGITFLSSHIIVILFSNDFNDFVPLPVHFQGSEAKHVRSPFLDHNCPERFILDCTSVQWTDSIAPEPMIPLPIVL